MKWCCGGMFIACGEMLVPFMCGDWRGQMGDSVTLVRSRE